VGVSQGRILIGNALMQNMKIVTNLKEQTIKIYKNYDCNYTPTPNYAPITFTQQITNIYEAVR
jgi:hypothetical protein